jgi:hypothetical protein
MDKKPSKPVKLAVEPKAKAKAESIRVWMSPRERAKYHKLALSHGLTLPELVRHLLKLAASQNK